MIGFAACTAPDLLLQGIMARRDHILAEVAKIPNCPPWRLREEANACRLEGWVRWTPSRWFKEALTPHQKNVAAATIRKLEGDGLVELLRSTRTRIYYVRLTPAGEERVRACATTEFAACC